MRVCAEFGWTPRQIDDLAVSEFANAVGMASVLRRERLLDSATAARIAQADEKSWPKAIRELEVH